MLSQNKDEKEHVKELVERNGLIYICGDASGMGIGIRNSLLEILGEEKYWQLIKNKTIREDLWR
jgi:sulfite reductase alpha subunit-like flavoprotein